MRLYFGNLDIGDIYRPAAGEGYKFVKIANNSAYDERSHIPLPNRKVNCVDLDNSHYCTMSDNMEVVLIKSPRDFLGHEDGEDEDV